MLVVNERLSETKKNFSQRCKNRARIQGFADRSEGGKKVEVKRKFTEALLQVH